MRRLLVDGYNLLQRAGRGVDEQARDQLVRDAARYRSTRRVEVVIVFDSRCGGGHVEPTAHPGVRVEYAAGDADSAILDLVRRSPDPRDLLVLTADRALARKARELGAQTEEGMRLLHPPHPAVRRPPATDKPGGISAEEVDYWLREFSQPTDDEDW